MECRDPAEGVSESDVLSDTRGACGVRREVWRARSREAPVLGLSETRAKLPPRSTGAASSSCSGEFSSRRWARIKSHFASRPQQPTTRSASG